MNYRNLLIASLITGASAVTGCSLTPDEATSPIVPDITETNHAELIEVNASLKPPAASTDFRPAAVITPEPRVTYKTIEFTIGDEGPASIAPTARVATTLAPTVRSRADFSGNASGPINMAPSYPERPVPAYGMTRQMVIADMGEPAKRIAGKGGSEVWDYGTLRLFFQNDKVAFSRVW